MSRSQSSRDLSTTTKKQANLNHDSANLTKVVARHVEKQYCESRNSITDIGEKVMVEMRKMQVGPTLHLNIRSMILNNRVACRSQHSWQYCL